MFSLVEVGMFIIVFGCGVFGVGGIDFDKLCYYIIILMMDVDVDGVYIWIFLLIFFY